MDQIVESLAEIEEEEPPQKDEQLLVKGAEE